MQTRRAMLLVCAVALSGGRVQAEETLPRVLILGDQVYQQPAADLKNELKGKAEIHYPRHEPGVGWNTTTALELLDRYLGEGKWDLIHVNCGLGDLIYCVPGMKSFRVMPRHAGGHRASPPEQYEKNLHTLAARLKATGAKIVWGSPTPIRHSSTHHFAKGSEIENNAIAG